MCSGMTPPCMWTPSSEYMSEFQNEGKAYEVVNPKRTIGIEEIRPTYRVDDIEVHIFPQSHIQPK